MKALFNPNENTAKVLSHSAMKQVLGGYGEESSPEGFTCRVRCTGWSEGKYSHVSNCDKDADDRCEEGYEDCYCS